MKKRSILAAVMAFFAFALMSGCGAMLQGELKLAQKNYEAAIPFFKETLSANPDDIRAGSRLGFAYLKTGRIDMAIEQLKNVLEKKPGEPYSTLYLGLAYLNNDQIGEAIRTWNNYREATKPLVEAEIKKQLTLLHIAQSQKLAQAALKQEKNLQADMPDTRYFYRINGTLEITATHPVYTVNGKWVKVSNLQVGDIIHGLNGQIKIDSFEKVDRKNRVYNFSVADSHNYFVAAPGADYFLVHNCK